MWKLKTCDVSGDQDRSSVFNLSSKAHHLTVKRCKCDGSALISAALLHTIGTTIQELWQFRTSLELPNHCALSSQTSHENEASLWYLEAVCRTVSNEEVLKIVWYVLIKIWFGRCQWQFAHRCADKSTVSQVYPFARLRFGMNPFDMRKCVPDFKSVAFQQFHLQGQRQKIFFA